MAPGPKVSLAPKRSLRSLTARKLQEPPVRPLDLVKMSALSGCNDRMFEAKPKVDILRIFRLFAISEKK